MRQSFKKALLVSALLVVVVLALAPAAALAKTTKTTPQGYVCETGWVYDNISYQGLPLAQLGPTYRDYNGSNGTANMTLTATVGGTVTLTVSGNVKVSGDVILAGVEVSLGFSVSYSLTASVSNSITIPVPSHKAGYGAYGVFRVQALGHYYYRLSNCRASPDYGYLTSYSPNYVGWNTWIGN